MPSAEPCRFIVGTPAGPSGSEWRAWVQGDEIYFGARSVAGELKYSFHASGRCHLAFDSRFEGGHPSPHIDIGSSRFQDVWERQEFEPGWSKLLEVISPTDELRIPRRAVTDSRLEWLPPAEPGECVLVHLLLSPPDRDPDGWPGRDAMESEFVWREALARGDVTWLVVTRGAVSPDEQINEARA
jgi:hypothetical protein